MLDLVGELSLAPDVGPLNRPAGLFDERVDPLDDVLDLVVFEVGSNDVQNFVIPQRGPPSYGFRPRIARWRLPPAEARKVRSVFYQSSERDPNQGGRARRQGEAEVRAPAAGQGEAWTARAAASDRRWRHPGGAGVRDDHLRRRQQ